MHVCSCGHDSCLSTPCQHSGGCTNTGDDAYACNCDTKHWAGANCEDDVDECLIENGGCGLALCHDTPGASRCGLDTCVSSPCQVLGTAAGVYTANRKITACCSAINCTIMHLLICTTPFLRLKQSLTHALMRSITGGAQTLRTMRTPVPAGRVTSAGRA